MLIVMLLLIIGLGTNLAFVQLTTNSGSFTKNTGISFLTYNIHGFVNNFDAQLSVDLILEIQPDVLVLQEAVPGLYNNRTQWPVQVIADHLNMSFFGQSLSFDQQNTASVAILSKFPIIDEYKIDLPSLDPFIKYLLVVTLDTPEGNLTVFGTHMERPFYPRVQDLQAQRIIEESENHNRLVFLCDCNSPDVIVHPAYHRFARYFEDVWIASGYRAWQGNTWPTDNPYLRVDYIWTLGTFSIIEDSTKLVGDETTSDHFGVYTELLLT